MGIRHLMSKKKTRAPLEKLERTIVARAANPNKKSYTSQLLAGGLPKIGAKVTEEAAEVVEAAAEPGQAGEEHFIREVGDLVYHLLVLMCLKGKTLVDLEGELARRFGVSGLTEKASRPTQPATNSEPATVAAPKLPRAPKTTKKKVKSAKAKKPQAKAPAKKAKSKARAKR
jgi:phosphoribosyl-ATP pyrophosphohydrolase